ncbi:putative AMP-binding enzyme C-terminal domain [Lyophyllum shimeji]|uniref:AMP-binding enzyme C-terminal domain n=1 Tax=Lyophyllum shimeji TaxID=47721 RepID=A0A9P3UUC3_LYOSH|nr:putative AMP-binding enzyme C-terminal domain [Lyophyllum shimeji]
MSATNEIFVIDRLKELMKVKGFQVAPAELEGCLLSHPDVLDCCIVGIPDDCSGELPLAYVVLTPDAEKRAIYGLEAAYQIKRSISKHVADRKVSYKQLKGGVEIVREIPCGACCVTKQKSCTPNKEDVELGYE